MTLSKERHHKFGFQFFSITKLNLEMDFNLKINQIKHNQEKS